MQVSYVDLIEGHRLLKCPCGEETLVLADRAPEIMAEWIVDHKPHHPGYEIEVVNEADEAQEIRGEETPERRRAEDDGPNYDADEERPVEDVELPSDESDPLDEFVEVFRPEDPEGGPNHSHTEEPFDLRDHVEECHEDIDPDLPPALLSAEHDEEHNL